MSSTEAEPLIRSRPQPQRAYSNTLLSPKLRGSQQPRTPLSELFNEPDLVPAAADAPSTPTASSSAQTVSTNALFSLALVNNGSVARDHLALERTFLAYVRTSLTVASAGVALVQLLTVQAPLAPSKKLAHMARPIGCATVILGLVVLFIGSTRYYTVQNALLKGKFPVTRFLAGVISVALSLLVTTVFAILLRGNLKGIRD